MDPNETVCFCNDVTRGMIKDAIAAGAKTLEDEDDLARGSQEEQAIDAGIDHAVDAALKGGNVELVIFGIGNNDGRDNAGEFLSCHKNLLSCLAGDPMPPTLVGSVQAV